MDSPSSMLSMPMKKEVKQYRHTSSCVLVLVCVSGHIVLDLSAYDSHEYTYAMMEKIVQPNTEDLSSARRFVLPLQENEPVTLLQIVKIELVLGHTILSCQSQQTGENLVQLEYTTATAVAQQDGSIYCTHETLTDGNGVLSTCLTHCLAAVDRNGPPSDKLLKVSWKEISLYLWYK